MTTFCETIKFDGLAKSPSVSRLRTAIGDEGLSPGFPVDPLLFFEGTRDPFCDLDLFRLVLYKVKAPWDLEIIDGGDHSFKVPKSKGLSSTAVYQRLLDKTVKVDGLAKSPSMLFNPDSSILKGGRTLMELHPLAGKPAPRDMLVNVPRLITAYFSRKPDVTQPGQEISFGTSGHGAPPSKQLQ